MAVRDSKGRIIYKPKKGEPSRFPKGVSGNLNGRTKGSLNRYSIVDLFKAINKIENAKSKSGKKIRKKILDTFVMQAYDNPALMTSLMKKLLPDLKSVESLVTSFETSMSDEMAEEIQKKLKERYSSKE